MLKSNTFNSYTQPTKAHGGKGLINFARIFSKNDLHGKWHFVDFAIIPTGASIGLHKHEEGEEMYYIMAGQGTMSINDETFIVRRGDVIVTRLGETHGLANDGTEDMSLFVVEIEA